MTTPTTSTTTPTTSTGAPAAAATAAVPGADPADRSAHRARGVSGLLREFNDLGLLHAADVHVARRLGAVTGEDDERVLLAVALAVRAVRHGSVVLHLRQVPETVVPEDVEDSGAVGTVAVRWPDPEEWLAALRRSPLLVEHAPGETTGPAAPLHLVGDGLWLDRYWRQELAVAEDLRARSAAVAGYDPAAVDAVLDRLWPGGLADDQRTAAAVCLAHGVSVLGGGPGTGKTTTVARLLAAVHALSPGPPRVALAAPTGKAAARLTEAVVSAAGTDGFTDGFTDDERRFLRSTTASTLHRLLGIRPGSVRARYDAEHRLPHDVVIVDEASMVGLGVMARLLAALRPGARLVLVGDPQQLASVEVGAVLADLVAPAERAAPGAAPAVPHGVALLRRTHRFADRGGIAAIAAAVRRGAAEEVVDLLRAGGPDVEFLEVPDEELVAGAALEAVRAEVLRRSAAVVEAARAGDAAAALTALDAHRTLCAHRRGTRGVSHWSALAQRWAVEDLGVQPRTDGRYVGLPVIVTANDPGVGVFNGDTGVVLDRDGTLVAAIARGAGPLLVPLARLAAVEPVHAMTVHRSQGSQFDVVTVLAAPERSPLATREMFYTALTRAKVRVRVVGSPEAVAAAVSRPLARATGLAERLRG
ncbi:exodeoxyribonuclease V alpha subunit [Kineococcus radiotolerans]|uniref:RecBCD enzyme subunit RecD n=1 Tax=Kineococcus radiotolerans TaxID=131568 RepID=A0A7W4TK12_KINRA|nr:exodeoxyribonuclease V subunit alpha [Kineococcus radiotolerans]MBB2900323.1 exodeoxyribonuclease V alpha subunit [Kineococcus radiotolerans]